MKKALGTTKCKHKGKPRCEVLLLKGDECFSSLSSSSKRKEKVFFYIRHSFDTRVAIVVGIDYKHLNPTLYLRNWHIKICLQTKSKWPLLAAANNQVNLWWNYSRIYFSAKIWLVQRGVVEQLWLFVFRMPERAPTFWRLRCHQWVY